MRWWVAQFHCPISSECARLSPLELLPELYHSNRLKLPATGLTFHHLKRITLNRWIGTLVWMRRDPKKSRILIWKFEVWTSNLEALNFRRRALGEREKCSSSNLDCWKRYTFQVNGRLVKPAKAISSSNPKLAINLALKTRL